MITLLFLLASWLAGPQGDELARAEQAWRAGDFALAMTLYEHVAAEADPVPGAVLYNLGNCAFRLDRPALAALYFRRAARRLPDDPDVAFNLGLTEQRLGVAGRNPAPGSSVTSRLRRAFPVVLAIVTMLELGGILGIALSRRRSALRFTAVGAVVLALIGAIVVVLLRWGSEAPTGVVLAPRAAVRGEPHDEVPALFRLRAGDCVTVPESSDRWVRVIDPRGTGWVERHAIGIVE
jgi:hypothetical protein